MKKLIDNKDFQAFLKKLGLKKKYASDDKINDEVYFTKEYRQSTDRTKPYSHIGVYQHWDGKDISLTYGLPTDVSFNLETVDIDELEKYVAEVETEWSKMHSDLIKIVVKARELMPKKEEDK